MVVGAIPMEWNGKSKCIKCGMQVSSDRDFCSKECENAFLKA